MNTLKKIIEDKGLTVDEVIEVTGCNPLLVYKYVEAESLNAMPLSIALPIAKVLGVNVEDLFDPFVTNISLKNGWNEIKPNFEIYIENWQVIKGKIDGKLVKPYLPCKYGGYDNVSGISISEIKKLLWF